MTLQSSGVISLQDIEDEFGGSGSIGLGEYYRGGSIVPDHTGTAGIPTSGAISFSDFYGAAALILNITTKVFDRATGGGQEAGVRTQISPNGIVEGRSDDLGGATWTQVVTADDWIIPHSAGGADYEIAVTHISGDQINLDSDEDDGTWLTMDVLRKWVITAISNKTLRSAVLGVEIRDVATQTVQASATWTILAENF